MAEIVGGRKVQSPLLEKLNWGMLSWTSGTYRNSLLISKDVLWFPPYMTIDIYYSIIM